MKAWKRELGEVDSKVLKLEKLLQELVHTNKDIAVTLSLKSEPINSDLDILTLDPLYDAADDNDKSGSVENSRVAKRLFPSGIRIFNQKMSESCIC